MEKPMSITNITKQDVLNVLNYDHISGIFTWKYITSNRIRNNLIAGTINDSGYILIPINKHRYRAHRLAWLCYYGEFPKNDIDHIDGNPANNCIYNLRDVTTAGNIQNQKIAHKRNKTSGLLGVSLTKEKNKFRARICTNGKQIVIGIYNTKEEAHEAYLRAKRELHYTCTI